MQAIITKYIPATNFKPSRVNAKCERGSLTQSWDSGLDDGENHRAACDALCARFHAEDVAKYGTANDCGWTRAKASGQIPDGRYVFCFSPKRVEARNPELETAARNFMEQTSVSNRRALRKALGGVL